MDIERLAEVIASGVLVYVVLVGIYEYYEHKNKKGS